MTVNERIKQVRQALRLSQAKFAKGISISNGYIAGIELGNRKANDRIIKLICSEYGVSEQWLKTGSGNMFDHCPDEALAELVDVYKELNQEFQEYILQQMQSLLEVQKAQQKDCSKARQ